MTALEKAWDLVMILTIVYLPLGLVWMFEGFVAFLWVAGFATCALIGICASWGRMYAGAAASIKGESS